MKATEAAFASGVFFITGAIVVLQYSMGLEAWNEANAAAWRPQWVGLSIGVGLLVLAVVAGICANRGEG